MAEALWQGSDHEQTGGAREGLYHGGWLCVKAPLLERAKQLSLGLVPANAHRRSKFFGAGRPTSRRWLSNASSEPFRDTWRRAII